MNENLFAFLCVAFFLFVLAFCCGGTIELRALIERRKNK